MLSDSGSLAEGCEREVHVTPIRRLNSIMFITALIALSPVLPSCQRSLSNDGANAGSRTTDLREQLEACRRQHEAQVSTTEVKALRAELQRIGSVADQQTRRHAAMQRVMNDYSRGVCLIHGIFTLKEGHEKTMKPVRDDDGELLELEYLGSGFLVHESGLIVTNRHVAEPWWNNKGVAPLLARGMEPAFIKLTVTFPERPTITIDPTTIRVSAEDADVAVMTASFSGVPVLPLSQRDPGELRGEKLMLLGYPTGLTALLARADPEVAAAALTEANDTTELIEALSRRHAISPVITHGTLSDTTARQLIYDAVTTSGGSGGPVFDPDGEVIGVNFAVLRDFQGSNFGVPIRFVRPLLARDFN